MCIFFHFEYYYMLISVFLQNRECKFKQSFLIITNLLQIKIKFNWFTLLLEQFNTQIYVKKYPFVIFLIISSLAFFNSGCKKINGLSKGNLSFSADTLVFDTVFTTIGSTTKQFKIYNKANKTVSVDEIELMGGVNSPFRINLDGSAGTSFSNLKIAGGDSLFAFIDVTLQVNNQTNPLVIQDSIRFRTNGVDQYVQLVVWGQDMYYHYSYLGPGTPVLDLNEGIWPNDKPHVIYGAAFVDSAKALTIQAGTKIYMHKDALLYVYKGTLDIQGTLNNEVTIQGDRLEADYDDVSGQYYGVYFDHAKPSTINYAIIKNGTTGIHLYDNNDANLPTDYTLTVTNTKIFNHDNNGIFIYTGAKVKAENCVVSKNGAFALLTLVGGTFDFNHCDLLGYNSQSQNQAVGVVNHFVVDGVENLGSINGKIYNSVIWGSLTSEIGFDTTVIPGVNLQFDIKKCLIKKETPGTDSFYHSITWNSAPQFDDVSLYKYTFPNTSPLFGTADPGFPTTSGSTIMGTVINPPNIGAY